MKTIKFLSMAALVLVGAVTSSCSSDSSDFDDPKQPANPKNVVTLTATVGFDEGAEAMAQQWGSYILQQLKGA